MNVIVTGGVGFIEKSLIRYGKTLYRECRKTVVERKARC